MKTPRRRLSHAFYQVNTDLPTCVNLLVNTCTEPATMQGIPRNSAYLPLPPNPWDQMKRATKRPNKLTKEMKVDENSRDLRSDINPDRKPPKAIWKWLSYRK